jgi:hypothetical protein
MGQTMHTDTITDAAYSNVRYWHNSRDALRIIAKFVAATCADDENAQDAALVELEQLRDDEIEHAEYMCDLHGVEIDLSDIAPCHEKVAFAALEGAA